MLPTLTQYTDTYQGNSVTVTKVIVDGEATLRLKDGLITDGTYIYRMIARADQDREIVVSIGNISVAFSLESTYSTFSQSFLGVVALNNPCVEIIFPTGTYYLYQVELDGNSVSSDLLEHIEEVSVKTDEAWLKAYQAMPKFTSSSSLASAQTKTTQTITNFSLEQGMRVSILFANANTAYTTGTPSTDADIYPKLSVSNTSAYPILTATGEYFTEDNLAQYSWPENSLVTFVFDGYHWRIDDSSALTKIDHILTEDIIGANGIINLKDGVFDYGQGQFVWDGTRLSMSGDIDADGTLHGAKIYGDGISIIATGDVTNESGLVYKDYVETGSGSTVVDGVTKIYKRVSIRAITEPQSSPGNPVAVAYVTLDPYRGSVSTRATSEYRFILGTNTEMIRIDNTVGVLIGNVKAFMTDAEYNEIATLLDIDTID